MNHLIFFDEACGLCQNAVNWILHHDKKKRFLFAPLSGKTASLQLHAHFDKSTMVLVEFPQEKKWLRGQGVFRILWLLGGRWKWIGWLYVAPFTNLFYRLVASQRTRFFQKISPHAFEVFKERFLP